MFANNANDAKTVITTNANPTIIVEINIPTTLLTLAPDLKRQTCSLRHSFRFIVGLL